MHQAVAIDGVGPRGWAGARAAVRLAAWAEAERGRFMPWLPVCMSMGVLLFFSLLAEPPRWLGSVIPAGLGVGSIGSWMKAIPVAGPFLGIVFVQRPDIL